ncbi:hypothetical protein [Streptomyces sp. NPDC058463]|uniref:hypothetical protein n=1 Tax=Streptomyces sp. NPDC058463 TaxID=3346510 RepID=UPI0036637C95
MRRIDEIHILPIPFDLGDGEVNISSQLLGDALGHEYLPTPNDSTDAPDDADSPQVARTLNLVDLQPAGLDPVYWTDQGRKYSLST